MKRRHSNLSPEESASGLPTSAVWHPGVLVGVVCFLLMFVLLRANQTIHPVYSVSLMIASYSLPIILLDIVIGRGWRSLSSGLHLRNGVGFIAGINIRRVGVKLIGFLTTILMVALIYALAPEYHGGFYAPFFQWVFTWSVPVLALSPIYIAIVDRIMRDPYDGYWHAGALALGWYDRVDLACLQQFALGWLVKAFFLPLMFVYFHNNLLFAISTSLDFNNFEEFYHFVYSLLILVDVGCIVFGYAITMRMLDNHIRSTEPTLFGWLVAIICYEPFWSLIGGQYLAYEDGISWSNFSVAESYMWLKVTLGMVSLLFMSIYVWASLAFGLRFSNLTNRGIITNGPYRYFKHPAYLSKNCAWWFESLPIISHVGRLEIIRNVIRLLLLNLVYYLRARTEERHLAADPTYRAYSIYMEKHGLLAWVKRVLPWVRFSGKHTGIVPQDSLWEPPEKGEGDGKRKRQTSEGD